MISFPLFVSETHLPNLTDSANGSILPHAMPSAHFLTRCPGSISKNFRITGNHIGWHFSSSIMTLVTQAIGSSPLANAN